MMDLLGSLLERYGSDVLLLVLNVLIGLALFALSRLPQTVRSFARALRESAKETETKADDAAAKALLLLADALEKALDRRNLTSRKDKER